MKEGAPVDGVTNARWGRLMVHLVHLYDVVTGLAPSALAARIDYVAYHLWPRQRLPFNGQARRTEMVREIFNRFEVRAVVETGTYRATTTRFFSENLNVPIYTVEAEPRFFHFSRIRLRGASNVECRLGDSRSFLRELYEKHRVPRSHVFFYLDAHWAEDLPLREEVHFISQHFTDSVVLIDDFEVPDDPGYGFDDYGGGKRLCLAYLNLASAPEFHVFWPRATSAEETGSRRGCVVLANGTAAQALERASCLRPARAA